MRSVKSPVVGTLTFGQSSKIVVLQNIRANFSRDHIHDIDTVYPFSMLSVTAKRGITQVAASRSVEWLPNAPKQLCCHCTLNRTRKA